MKKRYKILSIILALVIVLGSIVTISIVSSSASETFTDDNGIEWTVTENYPGWAIKPTNISTISGDVTIPATYNDKVITTIEDKAFFNCTGLSSISIPDSISRIGESAFYGCTGLTTIIIPDSVNELGSGIFSYCSNLTSVILPSSLKTLPKSTFSSCTSLVDIALPNSLIEIRESAFDSCKTLSTIDLPYNIKKLSPYLFNSCSNLNSINIPESVTEIGNGAFRYCTSLTSVYIPDSVTSIGNDAFSYCKSLVSIVIPKNVNYIGSYAFENCSNLTSVDISDNVNDILSRTFMNCSNLSKVNFGNGITSIGESAFYGCTSLTSVNIPNCVTSIGDSAFQKCSNLTNVNLSSNVTLGLNAFMKQTGITSPSTIQYNASTILTWNFIDYGDYLSVHSITSKYSTSKIEIPKQYAGKPVLKIHNNAFEGNDTLETVIIPDTIQEIGNRSFAGCKKLSDITIPNSVSKIGKEAFANCSSLTSIALPDGLQIISDGTFKNCTGLTGELIIPDGITSIGNSAFAGFNKITSVVIPNSVTTIGDNAFSYNTKLTNVNIPNSVTYLSGFDGCSSITSISIPDSVKAIGNEAFQGCNNLTNLIIPESVTSIGSYAFAGCRNLSTITLSSKIKDISDGCFEYCESLASITVPVGVTKIGERAFYGCVNLYSNNIIPNNVTYIGNNAFEGCHNIRVTLPNTIRHIGEYAFNRASLAFYNDEIGTYDIVIPKNVEYVGKYAFANLGELDTLTIENKQLSDISMVAFYNDTFKNYVVAESVSKIDTALLSSNKNIANLSLGANISEITDYAFYGNDNMSITTNEFATTVIGYANRKSIPVEIYYPINLEHLVNVELTCDKPGYEFTVYKVAEVATTENPYEVIYDSSIESINDEIINGDSEGLLVALDEVPTSELTEIVGTYSTDEDGTTKILENLKPGIYYARATDFPANVYAVQNSVISLPYFNETTNWWEYEIDPIPLATKVDESNPEIVKTITNSTKDNVNFTDVSLGDTVNFEIEASRVGSANVVESKDFRLNSYVVSDIMENGLTLNQDSFVVTLEDADGNTLTTLEDTTDYVVNVVASEGVDTTFTVSLTPEFLQEDEFYSSANVVIAYSAVLNKYSTREFDGNYNTATNLTYSNKTNVSATVEGNTVYAYTFGIEVNKYDDAGTPLAGSQFGLYLTEDDAKAMANAIATGTSTDTGKVEFFTESNDVIRLESGTYYIVETKATESYNRYTDVIPVTITVNYGDTEVNGTYIESAPENGIQLVEVKNSKVVIPNTGGEGAMYRYIIALAFAMLAVTLIVLKKRSSKKATAIK